MPPDCYKVEVLHLVNPHLIWVEVKDPAITSTDELAVKFEQIGIYGVLPLETTIDVEDEELTIQRCKEWQPASATLMRKFLTDEEDILFTPVLLDRRSSIFDDNIHKFGDLIIKRKGAKPKSLTAHLRCSGFATYDTCLFHQYLSEGKIKTKLNSLETQEVLTELEKYFINKNVPKKKWEKNTSVARASCALEEALTKTNLDRHNRNMRAIFEGKCRDFELCKGVDEISVGRATTRKGKEKMKMTPVEKKLELLQGLKTKADTKDQSPKANEHEQVFEDTKQYLETMAYEKIAAKTDAYKAQILKKVMGKGGRKLCKEERMIKKLVFVNGDDPEGQSTSSGSDPDLDKSRKTACTKPKVHAPKIKKTGQMITSEVTTTSNTLPEEDFAEKEDNNTPSPPKTEDHETPTSANNPTVQSVIDGIAAIQAFVNNTTTQTVVKEQTIAPPPMKEIPKNKPKPQNNQTNNNHNYNHNMVENRRHPAKGKPTKRAAKVDVYIPTLESGESSGPNQETSSAIMKFAYPTLGVAKEQETQIARRVPELPKDCEAYASKPVSEYMVKKLMSTFKLTGSKHSDMIQNAIRKCKDGAKNNSEAIAALLECRSKIIDEIKELDDPNNTVNLDVELPYGQTASKTKLKRRGRKNTVLSARAKTLFGPPGIDVNSLTRVPPVYMYGEEESTDAKVTEVVTPDEDSAVNSGGDKTSVPGCSYEAKPADPKMQETEIKKQKNENKDTSSSCSSAFEKRLKLHKEMAKNKRCASTTSDTTNKDSSNVDEGFPTKIVKPKAEVDSDESISDIIEKLGIENIQVPSMYMDDEKSAYTDQRVVVKANPFENFDINKSVFVDNLVTPVMMVHSKMNCRFVPACSVGDINFTSHIRLVLKNFSVDRPMMMQSISWNAILRGYSVFMVGSAGCGKTMGYLPAVCRMLADFNQSDSVSDNVGPISIIVCATSHSVSVVEAIAKMLVGTTEKVLSCYYGHDELAIATSLLNGCDLFICTVPSLVRLLKMTEFGINLQRLTTFVLDDCERLSTVYPVELKYCLYKIKDMLKLRLNKEVMVQYIAASRIWCDFMEKFARRAPDSVVCIGAHQECVLYSKANTTISYVKKENKLEHLMNFLQEIDSSKRTVIVCDTDEEVDFLNSAIQSNDYFIFASNSRMNVQQLHRLSKLWLEFREPLMAPVLVCRDANLYHMNVTNATYLIQYSMPPLYSTFCRRFATLNENYASIFKSNNEHVKILILLEESNLDQFPKIINFIKRCSANVPKFLDDICETITADKDIKRAKNFAPLCSTMLTLGECPDIYNCRSRHSLNKEYDTPKEWMPKSGTIHFKIVHYHSAVLYSARLVANYDNGACVKYPTTFSSMSLKMGTHYSNSKNRILLGIPKLGDVCAVAVTNNLYARGQIIKIVERCPRGNPRTVLVNLIDEEIIEVATDTNLYYLPDDLKAVDTYVCHIRLANIQPRDKDIVFSELAKYHVKKLSNSLNTGLYMKGNIVLAVANCIFIDSLETCQDLKSLKESVVMYNIKRELLDKHAEVNPDHITKIKQLCIRAGLEIKSIENKVSEPEEKTLPELTWAHLEEDMSMVDFGVVENPDIFFVRLTKFDECMKSLITDIQKFVAENPIKIDEFVKFDIILAEYPDDGMYERARIDEIGKEIIKCFFVDQGEWRHINKNKCLRILDKFITQLPFQAIECRLVGIEPPGDQWTDFAANWLFDKCAETECGATKKLYVKYCTKEPAYFTGGNKYGVVVIDTYGNEDVVLNQAMIDLNLAKEKEEEIHFIGDKPKSEPVKQDDDDDDEDDSWERVSKSSPTSESIQMLAPNDLSSQPIRSVPPVGTDDDTDDSEKWNINLTSEMAEMFRPFVEGSAQDSKPELPAIECNENEPIEEIDIESLTKNIEECSRQFQRVRFHDSSKDLDSDDLSSPEPYSEKDTSGELIYLDEALRKPKLIWRQTKTSVMIKIQLIGVDNYELNLQDRALTFAATVNDTNYGFEIELYGVIDRKNATHANKGQYILVKFNKIMQRNWLTLTKDGGIRKWIVYDVDSIDTSSDEEEVSKDNLFNIVKNIRQDEESDSDDEFVDDVCYGHKN